MTLLQSALFGFGALATAGGAFAAYVVWGPEDVSSSAPSPLNSQVRTGRMSQGVPGQASVDTGTASSSELANLTEARGARGLGENALDGAWGKFQTGDYEGAIVQLRAEFNLRPGDAPLQANLATALFALALVKVKAQQFAEAEKFLDESARLGNADAARTAASLKLKLGAVDLASGLFEELVDKAGQTTADTASLKVLVDVSLRSDDLDRADYFLDKLSPDDPFVAPRRTRLERKRAFAQVQDTVERGGVVEVAFADSIPRSLANAVAQAMEEAHGELAQGLLGTVPSSTRLKAFLYPQKDFRENTDAPPWAGGLFDGLVSIPVPRTRNATEETYLARGLARIARHETTHAYLYAFCGDVVPSWMGEGLAQKMEGRRASSASIELKKQGNAWAGNSGLLGTTPALDRPFTEASGRDVGRLYAQSFLLVNHYSRVHGGLPFWRGLLSRVCQGRESMTNVLSAELGEDGVASALWQRDGQAAMASP
ncbi:MAG: hypothetical protein IOD12_01760 [Silvanigrellales bacterium]|nr:hypothetical protein [Silvanigrellales bacterium]